MKSSVGLLMLVVFIANISNIVNDCTTHEFECADGTCIDIGYRCDLSSFECPDRTDEDNCTFHQQCPEGNHKCEKGKCVNNPTECPLVTSIVSLSSTIAVDIQSSFVSPTTSTKFISATSHPNTYTMQSSGLSSTVLQQLKSSSVFIPSTTTTHHSYQTSVIKTIPTSPIKTPPTDDQTPDEESNNLLYLLLLLIPLVALIITCVGWRYRKSMRHMIYIVTRRRNNHRGASRKMH